MKYHGRHVPGRLSVRIPQIPKNSRIAIVEKVQCLLDIYGVDHLSVNHLTGSVAVTFNTGLTSADKILCVLKANGLDSIARDERIQRAFPKAAYIFGRAFGKALESSGFPLLGALI